MDRLTENAALLIIDAQKGFMDYVCNSQATLERIQRIIKQLEMPIFRLHLRICLDALQLESLTWQKPEFFSELLAQPLEAKMEKGS